MLSRIKNILTDRKASSPRPQAVSPPGPQTVVPSPSPQMVVSSPSPQAVSSTRPQPVSNFALDETTVYQTITHSCRHCRRIVFDMRNAKIDKERLERKIDHDYRLYYEQEFKQDLELRDALHLARSVDCPLFKTFFKETAIGPERQEGRSTREDDNPNNMKKLSFLASLGGQHEPPPELETSAPEVFIHRKPSERFTSLGIYDVMKNGPPNYRLFHAERRR
jgi:hypothetical protein